MEINIRFETMQKYSLLVCVMLELCLSRCSLTNVNHPLNTSVQATEGMWTQSIMKPYFTLVLYQDELWETEAAFCPIGNKHVVGCCSMPRRQYHDPSTRAAGKERVKEEGKEWREGGIMSLQSFIHLHIDLFTEGPSEVIPQLFKPSWEREAIFNSRHFEADNTKCLFLVSRSPAPFHI